MCLRSRVGVGRGLGLVEFHLSDLCTFPLGLSTLSFLLWPECILFFPYCFCSHSFLHSLFPLLGTFSCTSHFIFQCSDLSCTILSLLIFPLYDHCQSFIEVIKCNALKPLEIIWDNSYKAEVLIGQCFAQGYVISGRTGMRIEGSVQMSRHVWACYHLCAQSH